MATRTNISGEEASGAFWLRKADVFHLEEGCTTAGSEEGWEPLWERSGTRGSALVPRCVLVWLSEWVQFDRVTTVM